jgi:hypothetical protein
MVQILHPGDCIAETPKPLDTGGAPAGQPSTLLTPAAAGEMSYMSLKTFFQNLDSAAHTFVAWVEKEYATFMKDLPVIEHYIEQGTNYAVGVLKIALSKVAPGSKAESVITKAIQDLLTANAVVYDAGAHPSVGGLFQAVVNDLSGLEAAMGFKNADTLATIAKVVQTLSAVVSVVLQIVPVAI